MASIDINLTVSSVSAEQALAVATEAEEAFSGNGDIARIVESYAEDVVINFGGYAEARGRAAATALLRARYQHISDYQLTKSVRAISGDTVCIQWSGQWMDPTTGRYRAGRGMECMRLRDGMVTAWDAAFNHWDVDEGPAVPPPNL